MTYEATFDSVRQHAIPTWYHDAKFGIFIHWTISSVPAFAPTGLGDMQSILKRYSMEEFFAHQPYAEWYQNSLRIAGSPASEYHRRTYGEAFPYENFAGIFHEQARQWEPESWAGLFEQAGARYAVLVTKHHDGFLLWPSAARSPAGRDYCAERDIVGELNEAVNRRGIKMGVYYSSALDWSFTRQHIRTFGDLITSGPVTPAYARYVETHWRELIDRYQPWVLWSDIGYPPNSSLPALFADYYNRMPEGVVNDRWGQIPAFLRGRIARWLLNRVIQKSLASENMQSPSVPHCDYVTTEYRDFPNIREKKWESVRGVGNSFAYNQYEDESDYLSAAALVRMLVDIVSKNGNLLLNVGPRPDGSIPEPQAKALRGIGAWLQANGEAIYGTRTWERCCGIGPGGLDVRYTRKEDCLYLLILQVPEDGLVQIADLAIPNQAAVTLLSNGQPLERIQPAEGFSVCLPDSAVQETVPCLRVAGI